MGVEKTENTETTELPPRLDTKAASQYLYVKHGLKRAPQTLAKLRSIGGGPRFRPGSGKPTYDIPDLDDFAKGILGETVGSTSEYPTEPRRPDTPARPDETSVPHGQAA
jgi:hypothetical protein